MPPCSLAATLWTTKSVRFGVELRCGRMSRPSLGRVCRPPQQAHHRVSTTSSPLRPSRSSCRYLFSMGSLRFTRQGTRGEAKGTHSRWHSASTTLGCHWAIFWCGWRPCGLASTGSSPSARSGGKLMGFSSWCLLSSPPRWGWWGLSATSSCT